jgi:hypothetical protein
MRKFIFLLAVPMFCFQALGANLSAITNNLYLAVQGWSHKSTGLDTNKVIQFDDELNWCPFCITGHVELNYPNPTHGIKIKMWNKEGKEVPKTSLGETYGSKWSQLHSPLDNDRHNIGGITAWRGRYYESDIFTGPILPSPNELFQMDESGVYTMEIQMQMFRHPNSNDTNEWAHNLFGFPPIKIKVEKPPETSNGQTNLPAD